MTIQVKDTAGNLIPARVHLADSRGWDVPGYADSTLMSHYGGSWMDGFFYVTGPVTLSVVTGMATLDVGRGFEWRARQIRPVIHGDTTITVVLDRLFDMRAEGWYSADTHVHAHHEPFDYPLTPQKALRIAEAEDLSMIWLLDNEWQFTGGPHPLSTPETVLYFTVENRNQTYGHAALLGLTTITTTGCCGPPWPAYPMLSQYREGWAPHAGQAMVLAHPATDAGFYDEDGWPGLGLGRELPVLATSGNLDAMDIASFSNRGFLRTEDWFGLMNSGYSVVPSAGTDAVANRFYTGPPGGYRVYAYEGEGLHTAANWVDVLRSGHVFVTNNPLIPEFTVNEAVAGQHVTVNDTTTVLGIHFKVRSALPINTATLIQDGVAVRSWTIPWSNGNPSWEHDDTLTVRASSWLALRVTGSTIVRHASTSSLWALTGAVRVDLNQPYVRRTGDAGHFINRIDSLQTFVERRGNWSTPQQHQAVLDRLEASRVAFRRAFLVPPAPFSLLEPADGETLYASSSSFFDWADAVDPEAGDSVDYRIRIAADTLFTSPLVLSAGGQSSLRPLPLPLSPRRWYCWQALADDRADNQRVSTPAFRRFYLEAGVSGTPPEDPGAPRVSGVDRLSILPNPTSGPVRLAWSIDANEAVPGGSPGVFEIFDVSGRCVTRLNSSVSGGESPAGEGGSRIQWRASSRVDGNAGAAATRTLLASTTWDGRDRWGRKAAAGVYWVRFRSDRPGGGADPDPGPSARLQIVR